MLAPVYKQEIIAGQTLTLTNAAIDPNMPPQILTFSQLLPPVGATINPTNGVFTWRPTIAQSSATYLITVVVTDNGSPSLSATNSFDITVDQPANPVLSNPGWSNGEFSFSVAGSSGPDYILQASTNLNSPVLWLPVATNLAASPLFNFTDVLTKNFNARYYRVRLGP